MVFLLVVQLWSTHFQCVCKSFWRKNFISQLPLECSTGFYRGMENSSLKWPERDTTCQWVNGHFKFWRNIHENVTKSNDCCFILWIWQLQLLLLAFGEFIGNCSVLVTEKLFSDAKDNILSFWHADTTDASGIVA